MDENYNRLRDDERKHIDSIFTGKKHRHMMARDALSHGLVGTAGGAVAGNIVGRVKRSKVGHKAVEAASSGFKNKVLNALNKNRLKDIESAARKGVSLTKYTLGGAAIGATGGATAGAIRGHHRFKKLKEGFIQSSLDRQNEDDILNKARQSASEALEKSKQQIRRECKEVTDPLYQQLDWQEKRRYPDKKRISEINRQIRDAERERDSKYYDAQLQYDNTVYKARKHYDDRRSDRMRKIESLKDKYKF